MICYRKRAPTFEEVQRHALAHSFTGARDEGLWIGIQGMPFIVRMRAIRDSAGQAHVEVALDDGDLCDWWRLHEDQVQSDEWCPCDQKGMCVEWPYCP